MWLNPFLLKIHFLAITIFQSFYLFKFKFFKTISCKSNINLYIFFLFFSTKCRVILFWCFCWITLSVGDTTFVEEAPGSPTHAFASLVGVANSNTLEVAPRNVCWFLKKNRCYWDCKSNINLYIFFSYFLKLNASCVFLHTIVLFSVCFFFKPLILNTLLLKV